MAKKKKTQPNPVTRGFATTSQPSKRAIAEAKEREAAALAESEAAAASGPPPDPDLQTASVTPNGDPSAVTNSKELDSEEQTWQDMVDRWQDKTDREIARTIKVIYPPQIQHWY
jgi:ATP-dependent RNA helicase DHX29